MGPSRRDLLLGGAGLAAALTLTGDATADEPRRPGLGIVLYSYGIRTRAERDLSDPLAFIEFCHGRGAGGVQLPLGVRDADYLRRLRSLAERYEMYVEGSLRPPRDPDDVRRFEDEVRTARAAGAAVVRSVLLGGRRYETFTTAAGFREFQAQALRALQLAAPVVERHRVRLAVENHKDFRAAEQAELLRRVSSEYVGACVDTGNNLALLEDPLDTVRALAPWAFCCHLKDMAVEEYPGGFLLSEVPLGDGLLDLPRIVDLLRQGRPQLRFGLEMITRDPLRIPCLTDDYWATLADLPARQLARTLAWVRRHADRPRLPRVSTLPPAQQLEVEDANVRRSFAYARERLRL